MCLRVKNILNEPMGLPSKYNALGKMRFLQAGNCEITLYNDAYVIVDSFTLVACLTSNGKSIRNRFFIKGLTLYFNKNFNNTWDTLVSNLETAIVADLTKAGNSIDNALHWDILSVGMEVGVAGNTSYGIYFDPNHINNSENHKYQLGMIIKGNAGELSARGIVNQIS